MVSFSVPQDRSFFNFSVEQGRVMFAGSRNMSVPRQVCKDLISAFGSLGFCFMTGCAAGVDESFRFALSESDYSGSTIVACAFKDRAERLKDVFTLFVVPDGLAPKVALAKRTLWMTSRCSLLILFPSDPVGKGSALAFKSAIHNNKPVFVVSKTKPQESSLYTVLSSNLFGVVDGFWCVPPVYADTGLCYETA
jgi:hypothetical protein